MKNVKFGNILDNVKRGMIVHGCNAQGVMGSGIALEIRTRWPDCFAEYEREVARHRNNGLELMGKVIPWEVPGEDIIIANAITQENFGRGPKRYVSYKAIHEAFMTVAVAALSTWGSHDAEGFDIHYPLIGAGLGGGDWAIISDIIESVFAQFPTVKHTLWLLE